MDKSIIYHTPTQNMFYINSILTLYLELMSDPLGWELSQTGLPLHLNINHKHGLAHTTPPDLDEPQWSQGEIHKSYIIERLIILLLHILWKVCQKFYVGIRSEE